MEITGRQRGFRSFAGDRSRRVEPCGRDIPSNMKGNEQDMLMAAVRTELN